MTSTTRTTTTILTLAFIFLLIPGLVIQYPYYLYERSDGSLFLYKKDPWGNRIPIAEFWGGLRQLASLDGVPR